MLHYDCGTAFVLLLIGLDSNMLLYEQGETAHLAQDICGSHSVTSTAM